MVSKKRILLHGETVLTGKENDASCRQRAEECLKAGKYREAIILYQTLIAACPDEESLLLALAWAYHDGGNREKAINCFEIIFNKELSRSVFTGFAYDELVRIYKGEGQYERLVDVCERAAAAQPQDMALLAELGAAYMKAGRTEDSITVFKKITGWEPDAASIYCLLGEAFIAKGEFAQAEAACSRAAEIDPEAACSFYSRLAHCYLRAGESERAEALFRKCQEAGGQNPLYHCSIGDCLIAQGKLAEAKTSYETAISLHPGSAEAFYNRWGNSLASAHYHHEAKEVFSKLFSPFPFS